MKLAKLNTHDIPIKFLNVEFSRIKNDMVSELDDFLWPHSIHGKIYWYPDKSVAGTTLVKFAAKTFNVLL